MHIVLDKSKSGSRKPSPLQRRFEELRGQIERQRRLNQRFEQDIDELTEVYLRDAKQFDRQQIDILEELARRLITFAGRKSLSDWHRDELAQWVGELINGRIAPLRPQIADQLREAYNHSLAQALGMSAEQFEQDVRDQEESLRQHFEDEFNADQEPAEADDVDDLVEEYFQDDLFGFADVETDPVDDDSGEADWRQQGDPDRGADAVRPVLDDAALKRLFRRAAQALHPDRESDPQRRQQKQHQMSELLRARKHGDIMTLLNICSDCLRDADIGVAEDEMVAICGMLERQLVELKDQQFEYAFGHPLREMVYDMFYHSSKKKQRQALQQWRDEMALEAEQNPRLLDYLRNLNCLKEVLRDRRHTNVALFEDFLFG